MLLSIYNNNQKQNQIITMKMQKFQKKFQKIEK